MTTAVADADVSIDWPVRQKLAQAAMLSRRSIIGTLRQPGVWMPGILFPMFIAAVNTSAMGRAVVFFPEPKPDSLLDFLLASSVTQAVLFGGVTAGADTALDIQTGFFDRLLASPVSRTSILVGRLIGGAVTGVLQASIFIAVYSIFGVRIAAGIRGVVVLLIYAFVLALVIGGFAAMLALRTGQAEAVQNAFPLTFILLFVSSAFFPTELMSGVYRSIAERNPITWMIDGIRHQVLVGFDLSEAAKAIGIAAVLAALTIAMANAALRARLRSAA
ncbi:MAG: type transport system permease protein [Nocardioidaceae bacterium]|nr:type transport system permease protein [Nocardioidaceae bacterium]